MPSFAQPAAEIREHIARLGADRVAELLRVAGDDLEPLLAGTVAPPPSGLRRLRQVPG